MAAPVYSPPRPPDDLPPCEHPSCGEPAPYGYGCTLRSRGRHFCGLHRPDERAIAAFACEEPRQTSSADLFSRRRA